MTRAKFDAWIERHYEDLWKVARRRVNSADEAASVVSAAVLQMLCTGKGKHARARVWFPDRPWTWAALCVRGCAADQRKVARYQELVREALKNERRMIPSHW
jgi:DNA-directed RNA polymerase specialized sigma24 family protein